MSRLNWPPNRVCKYTLGKDELEKDSMLITAFDNDERDKTNNYQIGNSQDREY